MKTKTGYVILSMFAFVTVVYCTPTKNRITAIVLDTARVSTNFILFGTILIFFIIINDKVRIKPIRNRANDISMPWIDEILVMYFANTVESEKVTAARRIYSMPLIRVEFIGYLF